MWLLLLLLLSYYTINTATVLRVCCVPAFSKRCLRLLQVGVYIVCQLSVRRLLLRIFFVLFVCRVRLLLFCRGIVILVLLPPDTADRVLYRGTTMHSPCMSAVSVCVSLCAFCYCCNVQVAGLVLYGGLYVR